MNGPISRAALELSLTQDIDLMAIVKQQMENPQVSKVEDLRIKEVFQRVEFIIKVKQLFRTSATSPSERLLELHDSLVLESSPLDNITVDQLGSQFLDEFHRRSEYILDSSLGYLIMEHLQELDESSETWFNHLHLIHENFGPLRKVARLKYNVKLQEEELSKNIDTVILDQLKIVLDLLEKKNDHEIFNSGNSKLKFNN
ncbi:hypothetical protein CROQUDRAFT_94230 [Cronartium quercuum f. sp. fusiforme G11]|uniref:Uncharacterized protein n=1 Tax=Cronartium quercuum f. sp. fusiforme G11 TaxID=708437 RepID=A0A9P6NJ53_9BASI|nr:hypothetical protein CROQUDRAFT_94230 [Cronartium quercuum f. sp. fusiforme G11]